jgi:energy-coupling factor transporter ATP-binding protein EcfA2
MRLPEVVFAADWSSYAEKRRLAKAWLVGGNRYQIDSKPEVIYEPKTLIANALEVAGTKGVALIGVDFPIGLPEGYAKRAGILTFRQGLEVFGTGEWKNFYLISDNPTLKQPFGPKSNKAGGLSKIDLAKSLGMGQDDLFRRCEKKTEKRNRAESMFYTRFAKQVGRSVIQGWNELIIPNLTSIRLWPFDGRLAELLSSPGIVLAEIYPTEAVAHLGLPLGSGSGKSKMRRENRVFAWQRLASVAKQLPISLNSSVASLLESGCDTDDEFDALVSLFSMIAVLSGKRDSEPPTASEILTIEGWILGQESQIHNGEKVSRTAWIAQSQRREKEQRYFIQRVTTGIPEEKSTLNLAYPLTENQGAINVICGLNNCGKSFLLNQIRRVIKGRPHNEAIRVHPLPRGQPSVLFFGKASRVKDYAGKINIDQSPDSLKTPGDEGEYRKSALWFLACQMSGYLVGVEKEFAPEKLIEPSVRQQIASVFQVEKRVYRCNTDDPIVRQLERLLNAHLYFRCTRHHAESRSWEFEFVLLGGDGMTLPFEKWSDGQKSCFYILSAIAYCQPEIILFDEIENHLHPALITEILHSLKAFPAQTIIASHHPHLIFSNLPDRIFYVDTTRPSPYPDPPRETEFIKRHSDPRFERVVLQLRDDFSRVSSAYKLFHYQDDQLMRQAAYLKNRAAVSLFQAIQNLFSSAPVLERNGIYPDAQTQQLADQIKSFLSLAEKSCIDVLDLGSGVGRQIVELSKLSEWQIGGKVHWTCHEPLEENRKSLRVRFENNPDVHIIESISEIKDRKFDLCIIANVLHELTPPEFAEYIACADILTEYNAGGIVILELFPLHHPEGFAVPYDSFTLRDILARVGFLSDSAQIFLGRTGITASCVFARRQQAMLILEKIEESVILAWESCLRRCLDAYGLQQSAVDVDSYNRILSNLTTVAAIMAWKENVWQRRPTIDPSRF